MPFNSTIKVFQTLPDKTVPLLLGGTGKQDLMTYKSRQVGFALQYQLTAAELQSTIARNASVILAYELEQQSIKKMISYCYNQLGTKEVQNEKYFITMISYSRKFLASNKKTLVVLRKIQTKLKRQRAHLV